MNHLVVIHDAKRKRWLRFENPVRLLVAHTTGEVQSALRDLEHEVNTTGLFAAGFLSYEAAPAFDPALQVRPDNSGFPLLWFGLYPPPTESSSLPLSPPESKPPSPSPCWTASLSRDDYSGALARLKQYLFAGDTYQVNYTFRLSAPLPISPEVLFAELIAAQGAHYGAFVDTGSFAICSASPELFFRLDGDRLVCRPMKGTMSRGLTAAQDLQLADALRASAKNRAENVMIVDMIRNDMGRIAVPGTVEPHPLFEVERYPTLWQMVSTVAAQTHASVTDIMAALFPCASITGAPKPRTMEIIASEETTARRIYTGTIGYLGPGRQAQFNVAIRTVLIDKKAERAEYGVGGGIVWDSETGNEYDECWLKSKILTTRRPNFDLLETLLWTPESGYFLLERHLGRLQESAGYFDIPVSLLEVRDALTAQGLAFTTGSSRRVRLLVSRTGSIAIESVPIDPAVSLTPVRVRLASSPIDHTNLFLYHKTTYRKVYEEAKSDGKDCDDVLLWNTARELTESTIATLVVERDGKLLTPPARCGLLLGTYRAELLERGTIKESVIRVDELPRYGKLYLVNSVRKWRTATLQGRDKPF